MKKIRLILIAVSTLLTAALVVAIIYPWYVNIENFDDMKYNILQIDSLVTMYRGNDSNFNGVPDLLQSTNVGKYFNPESEVFIDYNQPYYSEKYSYNYVDQRYALSSDSTSNLLNKVEITDLAPSKVYNFKYEIVNYVGSDNQLAFGFEADEDVDVDILADFDCRLGIILQDGTFKFTSWTDFVTNGEYNGINLKPIENMTVPAKTGSYAVGRTDLWLQLRAKPTATQTITSFKFPDHRISLSTEIADE